MPARSQVILLPAAPQDWLPQGHLAYFIIDTVVLWIQGVLCPLRGSRNQPFHPAMMVNVLKYASPAGEISSRKIERRLREDLAFRMLAAGNLPRHRTICDFRVFQLKELATHRPGGGGGRHAHTLRLRKSPAALG